MSPIVVDVRRGVAPSLAGLALAVLLASCAVRPPPQSIPKYVPPAGGQTAKLVMRGSVQPGDIFAVYVFDDSERCNGIRAVGAGNTARNPTTTTLAAHRIQTVEFFLLKSSNFVCSVRWSFTPVAGKTYLLSGNALASSNDCSARVMDASDPDRIKPEPTALRRNPGSTQCLPLAQSKGPSFAGSDAGRPGSEAVLRPGAGAEDLQGLIGR